MNVLAVETSSDACACAVGCTDGAVVARAEVAPRDHTTLLLPMVEEVLAEAGLALANVDLFAYGRGPGSFTGVRIAACVTQGLALAVDRPVLPVSSLAALAMAGGRPRESVLAVLDARMGEVYLGAFRLDDAGIAQAQADEQLAAPEAVPLPASGAWVGVGRGWQAHGAVLRERLAGRLTQVRDDVLPDAGGVCRLAMSAGAGAALPPEQALPAYLRRDVATPRRAR